MRGAFLIAKQIAASNNVSQTIILRNKQWHSPGRVITTSYHKRYYTTPCPPLSSIPNIKTPLSHLHPKIHLRNLSMDGIGRGTDLLASSLAFSDRPKIIFDGYGPTGFDIMGMPVAEKGTTAVVVHMNGSCLAFPHACYLWKPTGPKEVTLESLRAVTVHEPKIELFFIGSNYPLPPRAVNVIRKDFEKRGIVVEVTDLTNAMATFNILNGEDRKVGVAVLLDEKEDE